MQHEEALALLKDIRPMDVSFWQALFEWCMFYGGIALLCAVPLMVGWWWVKRYRAGDKKLRELEQVQRELQELRSSHLDAKHTAEMLVLLLKRTALARFGRDQAGLHGEEWLAWMDSKWGKTKAPSRWVQQGQLLLRLPYQPESKAGMQLQILEVIACAEAWVKAVEASHEL